MVTTTTAPETQHGPGLTRAAFDDAYQRLILSGHWHETDAYYHMQRGRYRRTFERLARIPLRHPARVLEIGGGQNALLARDLFGDEAMVADLIDDAEDMLRGHGLDFAICDLLHDDLPHRDHFDLVLLLEVVEHLTVPTHLVLEKVRQWIRPGGYLFITTPNLFRLRNVIHLLRGRPILDYFFHAHDGCHPGHFLEFSEKHLRYQVVRAGFEVVSTELCQLNFGGATPAARCGRLLTSPLLARPLWRDNLVLLARRPA